LPKGEKVEGKPIKIRPWGSGKRQQEREEGKERSPLKRSARYAPVGAAGAAAVQNTANGPASARGKSIPSNWGGASERGKESEKRRYPTEVMRVQHPTPPREATTGIPMAKRSRRRIKRTRPSGCPGKNPSRFGDGRKKRFHRHENTGQSHLKGPCIGQRGKDHRMITVTRRSAQI